MEVNLQLKMNPALYVKDPEATELGRKIIQHGVAMISEMGFEDFTFKKLAVHIGTTEAGIYRYFENKHKLLTYIITWFWSWLIYQLVFQTNNVTDTGKKLETIISLLCGKNTNDAIESYQFIDKGQLFQIAKSEGAKSYLTHHVNEDNNAQLFKPYKDLCHRIANIMLEHKPGYQYAHSLATTLIEAAHQQVFFKENLPSLTDFGYNKKMEPVIEFLNHLVLSALK